MSNKDKKSQLNTEMIKDYIKTYCIVFLISLGVISCFELCMIVRSLLREFSSHEFLSQWDNLIYFISYWILLACSVATFVLLSINRKTQKLYNVLSLIMDIFGIVIILWGAGISLLDVYNGNTPIVYLTVIIFVAAILMVYPPVYSALVTVLSTALICVFTQNGVDSINNSGYVINFIVFTVFSILFTVFSRRLKLKAYLSKMQLERLSFYDKLTGAYNRHSLNIDLKKMSKENLFYFGIVDIDNFKSINDIYGHDSGDMCLTDIATLLKEKFGEKVYRYGGDEFVIITTQRQNDIKINFDAVNELLKQKFPDKDVHISGGFYSPLTSTEKFLDYFRKSDYALYNAKAKGKCLMLFYEETDQQVSKDSKINI